MEKKITALLAGILTIVFGAYAQRPALGPPTVTFTAVPTVVCAGTTTTFTNTTTNTPSVWTWYFPGGIPSSWSGIAPGNPPPIKYLYTGTYNVTCIVKNNVGSDSVTMPNYIFVEPVPTAAIAPASGGICDVTATTVEDTIAFSLYDTNIGNTYSWAPAVSLKCPTCPNPKAFPHSYTVYTLTVQGPNGCISKFHDTVQVGDTNIRANISGKSGICLGYTDSLTASGGATNPPSRYSWSNGLTTSSITVKPTVTTVYSVTITTGSGGCSASATFTVNVYPVPKFTINYSPSDSICYPQSVNINVSPPMGNPYQYSWFGPPNGVEDTDIFTVSPITTTTYTLLVVNQGCYYYDPIKIKVNQTPTVIFSGATNLCQGASTIISASGGTQYHWSNNASTSSIDVEPPVSITYTVQVRKGACFKDTAFTITVDTMPNIVFTGDTSICRGDSTTVYASQGPGYTYNWNNGATADSIFTGAISQSITYYVTVTKGACSKDSAQITVKVYAHPKPKVYPIDTTICEYDSVQLTATGGDYYIWTPKKSGLNHYLSYDDTDRNNASPPISTVYGLKVCTWGCCKDTSIKVNITPNVQGAKVCCDTTVQGGTPVTLSSSYSQGPFSFQGWYPATGLSCSSCPNPTSTIYSTTKYYATFLDNTTGCIVRDSITIDVFNCNIFVPNIFSPGEEVNNRLYVRSICIETMTFAVYDRFGNQVFETQNQNIGWDGNYKGKPMNMGTYIWYLTGLLQDGTNISKSGNVTLVR